MNDCVDNDDENNMNDQTFKQSAHIESSPSGQPQLSPEMGRNSLLDTTPIADVMIHGVVHELDNDENSAIIELRKRPAQIPRLALGAIQMNYGSTLIDGSAHQQLESSFEIPGQLKSPTSVSKSIAILKSAHQSQARHSPSLYQTENKLNNWKDIEAQNQNSDLLYQMQEPSDIRGTTDLMDPLREEDGAFTPSPLTPGAFHTQSSQTRLMENQGRTEQIKRAEQDDELVFDDSDNQYRINEQDANELKRIGRSKTTEIIQKNKGRRAADDQLIEMSDFGIFKSQQNRKFLYKENEICSDAKFMTTNMHTDENLAGDYQTTQRFALATDRQMMKSSRSSLFGSVQMSGLRSARQIIPKQFRDLRINIEAVLNRNKQQQQGATTPNLQNLTCPQLIKFAVKQYIQSCIDGIFLRHLFCKAIPLKCYLFFMAATDLLLALVDVANLYSRIHVLTQTQEKFEIVSLSIAAVFFCIKLIIFIPMFIFEIKLIKTNKQRHGKVVYGIKLALFFIFLLFHVVGMFFINQEGCNVFHATVRRSDYESMLDDGEDGLNQSNSQADGSEYNPMAAQNTITGGSRVERCEKSLMLAEVFGLFLYNFLSCWVILSVLHWIRRGRTEDHTQGFLNLINSRQTNAIVANHEKGRPLVNSRQLQKQKTNTQTQGTPRGGSATQYTNFDGEDSSELEEDYDLVRLNSNQKNIHVNLKQAMRSLKDFQSDSQRNNRRQKKTKTSKGPQIKTSARGVKVAKK